MPFGRYTCGFQGKIVFDGVTGPLLEEGKILGVELPAKTLPVYDSPGEGGSTDQRFHILPNDFGRCCY